MDETKLVKIKKNYSNNRNLGDFSLFKLIFVSSILIVFLVFLDQTTKTIVFSRLSEGESIPLIEGVLEFTLVRNSGAAFSFLTGAPLFFIIFVPIVLIIILFFYIRIPRNTRFIPLFTVLSFVIAGAIGNYIDRVLFYYVRDFIYFSLIDFPVFNVADIYVTCSMFVLIFLIIFVYKEDDLKGIL